MESNFRSNTFSFYSVWRGVTLVCVTIIGSTNLTLKTVFTSDKNIG